MVNRLIISFLFLLILPAAGRGQVTHPGPGYQMILIDNPALSGVEGDGILRLSYLNFYPGNNYNLHSVYFSYDSYLPSLHGGAGIYFSDDYLGGIVNDFKGGFSYSYFLQAGKDLFITGGLAASVYHRGYNFGMAVLPDQIDPLGGVSLISSEGLTNRGHSVFDIGTGFFIMSRRIMGGFSIKHLAEPNLAETGLPDERLSRELFLHIAGDFDLSESQNLKVRPICFAEVRKTYFCGGGGAVLESNFLAVNFALLGDNAKNANIQTGFSINSGKVSVYYNYRFNIASENNLLPISLLHQTGLAISLYNVDKKNVIKTIKFPKL